MATRGWLRSKGNSIEGGTSEVNVNVVAKRVLGLPRSGEITDGRLSAATLTGFREEAREWIEANLPASGSTARLTPWPIRGDARQDRRIPTWTCGASAWLKKAGALRRGRQQYGGGGLDPADARVSARSGAGGKVGAPNPDGRHGNEHVRTRPCSNMEPRIRSSATSRRSAAARSVGARAIRSRAPDQTSRPCRPSARTPAIIGRSTVRRSGPAAPSGRTGVSASFVPMPRPSKHEGISFVLIDMHQPGVETRPIKLIAGSSPFCETFFTDARVEKNDMVGPLNGGWSDRKTAAAARALAGQGGGRMLGVRQERCLNWR